MNLGNSIYDIILQMYGLQVANAMSYAGSIEPFVRGIAAIGALIYIFSRLFIQIYSNQEIDILPFLRPFLILLLIPFSGQIATAIDSFGNSVRSVITVSNDNIAVAVEKTNKQIQAKIDKKWETIGNDPEVYAKVLGSERADDEDFLFGSTLVDLKLSFYKFSEDFKFQILTVIQNILLVIMYIAECILLLISVSYRIVLRIGFPITVALAIFPGFSNALATWFGKYINFAILPAVAAMYSSIAFNLVQTYVNSYDVDSAMSSMGIETQQPEFLGLAFIGLLFMSLIGYTQIPSMTAMLVGIGGVGQIISVASRNISNARTRTSATIGAAATGAVRGSVIGAMGGAVAGSSAGSTGRTAGAAAGGLAGGIIGAGTGTIKSTIKGAAR
jgi:hypothetical protein